VLPPRRLEIWGGGWNSDRDPLNLIERDPIARTAALVRSTPPNMPIRPSAQIVRRKCLARAEYTRRQDAELIEVNGVGAVPSQSASKRIGTSG
jgi:hypothetical protein